MGRDSKVGWGADQRVLLNRIVVLVMVSVLLVGAVGTVTAGHETEAGASMDCDEEADVAVNDGDRYSYVGVDHPEPQDTADAVQYLATNNGSCTREDDSGGYIEGHVSVYNYRHNGYGQVCISNTSDSDGGPTISVIVGLDDDEPCPTEADE